MAAVVKSGSACGKADARSVCMRNLHSPVHCIRDIPTEFAGSCLGSQYLNDILADMSIWSLIGLRQLTTPEVYVRSDIRRALAVVVPSMRLGRSFSTIEWADDNPRRLALCILHGPCRGSLSSTRSTLVCLRIDRKRATGDMLVSRGREPTQELIPTTG
jgi:hypothetical protein